MRFQPLFLLFLALAAQLPTTVAQVSPERQVIDRAKSEAVSIPRQVAALTRLAWFEGDPSGKVAQLAKQELVGFGGESIPELRGAFLRVDPALQHEVVGTMITGRRAKGGMVPTGYVEGLTDFIWDGGRAARELAIPELALYRPAGAVLPIIDAASEDPELLPIALPALGLIGNDRARHYLADLLRDGEGEVPGLAAAALARIHGRALGPLREGLLAEREVTRVAAARALLPIATLEDLSALYEYYGAYPDDDPELRAQVRDTASRLELLLQQQQEIDAASPGEGG
jgi:HEAT repeat protein